METKEQLVNKIKEWMSIENEIKDLRAEIRELNNRKKSMTSDLMAVMKENEIDCFDIKGGSIVYKQNKVKKPINSKTLMTTLSNFFKNDNLKAEELTKYILENREEQVRESIKHKVGK
jgi:predicted  nucleic acid-binding Zn-ribbon protein